MIEANLTPIVGQLGWFIGDKEAWWDITDVPDNTIFIYRLPPYAGILAIQNNVASFTTVTTTGLIVGTTEPPVNPIPTGDLYVGANATITKTLSASTIEVNDDFITDFTGSNLTVDSSGVLNASGSLGANDWQFIFDNAISPTTTATGLYITASSTISANFRVEGNATVTDHFEADNIFFVKDSEIGIGTRNPTDLVSVFADTALAVSFITFDDDPTDTARFKIGHARGTEASPTATQDVDIIGEIRFGGWDTALSFNPAIRGIATAEWGTSGDTSDEPTAIAFFAIADGSGNAQEIMRVNDKGVGIFSTTSARGLTMGGAGATKGTIVFSGTLGGGGEGILYTSSAGSARNALTFPGSNEVRLANRGVNGFIQIGANTGTGGSSGEVIVARFEDDEIQFLLSGGNVGIGTASPEENLELLGSMVISNDSSPSTEATQGDLVVSDGRVVIFAGDAGTITHTSGDGELYVEGDAEFDDGITVGGGVTGSPFDGEIFASSTSIQDMGWDMVAVTNQACNDTCTYACVFGYDDLADTMVSCGTASADKCLCAGPN